MMVGIPTIAADPAQSIQTEKKQFTVLSCFNIIYITISQLKAEKQKIPLSVCLFSRDKTTHSDSLCRRRRDALTVFSRRRRTKRSARSTDMKKGVRRASDRETSSRLHTITCINEFLPSILARRPDDMWMRGDVLILKNWMIGVARSRVYFI